MAAFPRSKGSSNVKTRGQQLCESCVVPFSVQGRKYENPTSAYEYDFDYTSKQEKLHDKWDDQSKHLETDSPSTRRIEGDVFSSPEWKRIR
jgi:hypothetical protein